MALDSQHSGDTRSVPPGKTGRGMPGPRTVLLMGVAALAILGIALSLSPWSPFTARPVPTPAPGTGVPATATGVAQPPTPGGNVTRATAVPTIIYTAGDVQGPHVTGITAGVGMASYDLAGRVPIAVSFSTEMERSAAQGAFRLAGGSAGAIEGIFNWVSGNTVVFTPGASLAPSTVYTVTLAADASTATGEKLAQPALATFQTAPAPAILRTLPAAAASEVPTDTVVTLQFNRPLIPLTSLDAQPDVSQWIEIAPAVEGRFQWLGTSTLGFRPRDGFRPSTTYTVRVRTGLPDANGVAMEQGVEWTFTTIRPAILSVTPSNGAQQVDLDAPIVIRFNQPMDRASVESALRLSPVLDGAFSWSAASDVVTFTQKSLMPFATRVQARIDAPLRPLDGEAATLPNESSSFSFTTVEQTHVAYTFPDRNRENEPANTISLGFNNALQKGQDVAAFLAIDPVPEGYKNQLVIDESGHNVYTHEVRLAPNTTYNFTLREGLKDRYGAPVRPDRWSAKTGPQPPGLDIKSNVFQPILSGAPARVRVEATNLDRFTMRLYRLTPAELKELLMPAQGRDYNNYRVPGTQVRSWEVQAQNARERTETLWPAVGQDAASESLPAGYWVVEVTAPAPEYMGPTPLRDFAVLVSGKTALTAKYEGGNLLVWAVDLATGRPAAGVPLRVEGWLENQPNKSASGTTGADGVLRTRLDFGSEYKLAIFSAAEGDGAFVFSDWSGVYGPWYWGVQGSYGDSEYQSAIYTDRPIYRPGHTVYFRGVMRLDDDVSYSLPQGGLSARVRAAPTDRSDNPVYEGQVRISPTGTFDGEFILPEDAPTGAYYLIFNAPVAGQVDYGGSSVQFDVEEYRKPDFQVGVTTNKPAVVQGEQLIANVSAGYYFGGPLSGVTTTVTLQANPYYFSWSDPDTGESYTFTDVDWYYWMPRPDGPIWQKQLQLRTGPDGVATLDITGEITTTDRSKVAMIEGQVQDLSNQAVANRTTAIVHQGQYYVGLRTETYVATAKEPMTLTVRTVAPDESSAAGGRVQPNAEVRLRFYETEWRPILLESGTTEWRQNDELVGEQTARTDARGRAVVSFSPPRGGYYRVEAESRDAAGHVVKSSIRFWASDRGAASVGWRLERPNGITLVADKELYRPGDTATILVTSPFSQATGLLTVERGHLRRYYVVNLQGAAPTVEVPLEQGDIPNVYVGLTIVGAEPRSEDAPGMPADQVGRTGLRMGYVELQLDASQYELQVQVEPQGRSFEPGATAPVTIRTLDKNGAGTPAQLSLAVVDEAIFAMSDDKSPLLSQVFYGTRGLKVNTTSSFSSGDYGPFPVNNGRYFGGRGGAAGGDPESTQTGATMPMEAPAAAQDSAANRQNGAQEPGKVRVDFRDTAHWTANVTTGPDGTVTVQVPLPDNLTTWRLTARGATSAAQLSVGAASSVLTVTQPLLLRPVVPRFLVHGDRAAPQAIVHNNTANELTLIATVEITGAGTYNMGRPVERELTIPAGGEEVVTWGFEVGKGDSVGLRFWVRATAGLPAGRTTLEDAVQVVIPVHPLVAPEAVATSGEVGKEARETVFIPYGVNPQLGELVVDVSPSLAAGTVGGLTYLKEYPYEGTEHVVSRFLPLVVLEKAFREQGRTPPLANEAPGITRRALQRLAQLQLPDGGWGWWDESLTSDAFLTAYAVQGLLAARDGGYEVDGGMLDRGLARLQQFLAEGDRPGMDESWSLDLTAYELYVLSLANPAQLAAQDAGHLDRLLQQQARIGVHARAWLALALDNMGRGQDARSLLDSLASAAKQTSTLAHWEEDYVSYYTMATDTRATALVLDAMVQMDPGNGLVQKAVRWLMSRKEESHWRSTQETAIVIVSLAHYMQQSRELSANYDWQVSLFGQVLGQGSANAQTLTTTTTLEAPVEAMPQNVAGPLTLTRSDESGKMYYSASLRYFLPGQGIKSRSEGLSIARTYYLVPTPGSAGQQQPVSGVHAGDLVKIQLTIVVPETSYYLMVEDPLPAGLEGVNGSLNTTSGSEKPTYPGGQRTDAPVPGRGGAEYDFGYSPWFYRWGPFQKVEMRDDRTVLFADYVSPGTYVFEYFARATTPGQYMSMPAHARLMYFPDVFGRSDGGQFLITTR